MKVQNTRGFTLVELLVVIAIIGMLIALLLPAVQAAREASRRSTCSNKLRQIGIAAHNHHDIKKTFPAGGYREPGTGRRLSGFIALLPYIELVSLSDAIVANNYQCTAQDDPRIDEMRTTLVSLICPSDGGGTVKTNSEISRNNYRLCNGDYPVHGNEITSGDRDPGGRDGWPCPVNRGVFGFCVWNGTQAISDGTSNTVLASERCISTSTSQSRQVFVAAPDGGWAPDDLPRSGRAIPGANEFPVNAELSTCLNLKGNGGEVPSSIDSKFIKMLSGKRWTDGSPVYTGFSTILPPNSASCIHGGSIDGNGNITSREIIEQGNLIAPSSFHSGGVNVAVADASVRFVSDSIDWNSSNNNVDENGPSLHGVWGGLGSRNGGESVSFP